MLALRRKIFQIGQISTQAEVSERSEPTREQLSDCHSENYKYYETEHAMLFQYMTTVMVPWNILMAILLIKSPQIRALKLKNLCYSILVGQMFANFTFSMMQIVYYRAVLSLVYSEREQNYYENLMYFVMQTYVILLFTFSLLEFVSCIGYWCKWNKFKANYTRDE